MSERGVFGVDRGVFGHEVFTGPLCEHAAWLWICGEAAWKARRVRVGAATITLARGQLCHSLRFMGEAWGWNRMKVHRFLDKLQQHGMVETHVVTGQTLITVCNYATYQRTALPERDSTVTGPGQHRDEQETRENIQDFPVGGARADEATAPARRLPPGWELGELERERAAQAGLAPDRHEPEFRRFRAHHLAKGSVSLDWLSSWELWASHPLRDAYPAARTRNVADPPGGRPPTATGRAARLLHLSQMAPSPDAAIRPDDQLRLPSPGHDGGAASGGRHYREVPFQSGSGERPSDEVLRCAGLGAFNPREAAARRRARTA